MGGEQPLDPPAEVGVGPWQGPWPQGVEWEYVEDPVRDWLGPSQRDNQGPTANPEGSPAIAGTQPFTHEQHMPT